jgi:hypothetical protein
MTARQEEIEQEAAYLLAVARGEYIPPDFGLMLREPDPVVEAPIEQREPGQVIAVDFRRGRK